MHKLISSFDFCMTVVPFGNKAVTLLVCHFLKVTEIIFLIFFKSLNVLEYWIWLKKEHVINFSFRNQFLEGAKPFQGYQWPKECLHSLEMKRQTLIISEHGQYYPMREQIRTIEVQLEAFEDLQIMIYYLWFLSISACKGWIIIGFLIFSCW